MRIIQYCQHVLGIGHYFRSLEIARALHRHQLVFVSGGPPVAAELPSHVSEYVLPGLQMDSGFSTIFPTEKNRSLEEVQEERTNLLYSLFEKIAPDLFVVELYPFGRKRFHFELLPILKAIHRGDFGSTRVVCSLRDILVEKKEQEFYERKVLEILNKYFGALLVHADATLVSLDETFARTADIKIPVVYTGYVTARPGGDDATIIKRRLELKENEPLIVASAGGGRVGADLLKTVLDAHARLTKSRQLRLCVFTGPFMAEGDFSDLQGKAASVPKVQLARFTTEFLSYLAAADLSISMAGYNTCMNILAARVPSLVWPFAQNQEQRLRAEKLAALGGLTLLNQEDLEPTRLAVLMEKALMAGRGSVKPLVNLAGAEVTTRWLEEWCDQEEGRKP
ncbi:MAG: glycosyl transferase [Deltaproteobacteria bacterium]|nr:glycosyl transferase [Deltaproteobacteria bacterium]